MRRAPPTSGRLERTETEKAPIGGFFMMSSVGQQAQPGGTASSTTVPGAVARRAPGELPVFQVSSHFFLW